MKSILSLKLHKVIRCLGGRREREREGEREGEGVGRGRESFLSFWVS